MKKRSVISRWPLLLTVLLGASFSVSCMTTYDSYGRPVQSVDPGAAVFGAAAAGLVGYAIGNSQGDNYYHSSHTYHQPYYPPYHSGYDCY
jgi:hypothetical protein